MEKVDIRHDPEWQKFSLASYSYQQADSSHKLIKINKTDKLCLIPYGLIAPDMSSEKYDKKYKKYADYLDVIINDASHPYIVQLPHTSVESFLDIFCLYMRKIKTTYCDDVSIYEHFLDTDSNLVFNGYMQRYNGCWFLCFDS